MRFRVLGFGVEGLGSWPWGKSRRFPNIFTASRRDMWGH